MAVLLAFLKMGTTGSSQTDFNTMVAWNLKRFLIARTHLSISKVVVEAAANPLTTNWLHVYTAVCTVVYVLLGLVFWLALVVELPILKQDSWIEIYWLKI
ncbi:hypothetical protein [Gimesia sp.]|uniref:hypothetical protein n=1 Tax=Gimesia sp. TaxID=2024833 RepID=UPI003A90FC43